ncbi:DMT family transporter [Cocleimonas flava]|uniref:Drug/metabolite transporter (DMT)-like permease n=1 Tax=Cocleimonas flava TaxID=634765 RepID=A0A4R1EXP1_9GAMM|nr:DMT family transporter [Cocleimonas flava]TCJ82751.1 drug/metabolite transporter (DMT)-like permease [Cocleimonas flava]
MTRFIPIIFVLLWSTGFIGAKFGLPYAEPFTMLMWRMIIVVPLFFLVVLIMKRPSISGKDAAIQGLVGLLIHGFYLGGVFAAISVGMPTGLTSLYVSLNPILIAIFSGIFLHTIITKREWLSLFLGFLGVAIVIYGASKWEGVISAKGIGLLTVALVSICAGTLIQKKYAQNVGLIRGSMYQYASSLLLYLILSFTIETGEVEWNLTFIATLAWLVIVLSFAAVLLLMYMIQNGEATKVASYFYLVPPITVLQGWLFFDEQLSWLTFVGGGLVVFALMMGRPLKAKTNK